MGNPANRICSGRASDDGDVSGDYCSKVAVAAKATDWARAMLSPSTLRVDKQRAATPSQTHVADQHLQSVVQRCWQVRGDLFSAADICRIIQDRCEKSDAGGYELHRVRGMRVGEGVHRCILNAAVGQKAFRQLADVPAPTLLAPNPDRERVCSPLPAEVRCTTHVECRGRETQQTNLGNLTTTVNAHLQRNADVESMH
jgi:hypothetical protein